MAYCKECGAALQEGTKFCTQCGAPAESGPVRTVNTPPEIYPTKPARSGKKPFYKKWWFWVLVLLVVGSLGGGAGSRSKSAPERSLPTAATAAPTPRPTAKPTPKPTPVPTATPAPAPAETEIRPEVKAFLDSYEACMDEYVAFMEKYMNADTDDMLSMMGDYYSILSRYTEFSDAIDQLDESELTNAELAYYLEVTTRVEQKLLRSLG